MAPSTTPSQPANGVLPIPAAVLQKQSSTNAPRGPVRTKPTSPRLKVVIRRLPPGLTREEFEAVLGEEWRSGGAKVDWSVYKAGKISKDLAKPSRPSRAYLHVTEQAHLKTFSDHVLQSSFVDAKNSSKDAALIGPPSLEFAPYNRIPSGRKRNDARQGTIDQDPEFIEFLQMLTDPITKPALSDADTLPKKEVVKTTPLIEHLREKKAAARDKPNAAKATAKHGRQESKDSKVSEKPEKKAVKGATPSLPEKGKKLTKAEKAAREAVKVLNREAAAVAPAPTAAAERKRERVAPSISVAAKIQRDLGLAPAGGRRARREATSGAQQTSTAEPSTDTASTTAASTQGATSTSRKESRAPRGRRSSKASMAEKTNIDQSAEANKKVPTGPAQPTVLLKKPAQTQPPKALAPARPSPPQGPKTQTLPSGPSAPQSDAGSTTSTPATPTTPSASRQAFLKHANPSQGITETLIEEALSVFGQIEKVEIDRKKGFAYVNFVDNEGLRKAVTAGSVKVAQGAVQVLERRDRPAGRPPVAPVQMQRGGFRGRGSSRGRGGRGGAAGATPASPSVPAAAPVAPPSASTSVAPAVDG